MKNKEHFDFLVKNGVTGLDPTGRVRSLVTFLLDALQKPSLEHATVLDRNRLKEFGLDITEPVNWASLNVCEVTPFEDGFLVEIEEAAPDVCPELCAYIEKYMNAWGWKCKVKTEW